MHRHTQMIRSYRTYPPIVMHKVLPVSTITKMDGQDSSKLLVRNELYHQERASIGQNYPRDVELIRHWASVDA